jgi:hypothetical protein
MSANHLIQHWMHLKDIAEAAAEAERDALAIACYAPIPENLRPATSKDIVEGAILWYPEFRHNTVDLENPDYDEDEAHEARAWRMVELVERPRDRFKAFSADDGCRYGLEGAFVDEDEDEEDSGD